MPPEASQSPCWRGVGCGTWPGKGWGLLWVSPGDTRPLTLGCAWHWMQGGSGHRAGSRKLARGGKCPGLGRKARALCLSTMLAAAHPLFAVQLLFC